MSKYIYTILMSTTIYAACGASICAADCSGIGQSSRDLRAPKQQSSWTSPGGNCGRHQWPLDTSIFSLYGSYGPQGGPTYWGAYTSAGWSVYDE
jgi:hypothetical protein